MVDVTLNLMYFGGSLAFCFMVWNPFLPIVAQLALEVALTRTITQEMVLPGLGAAMWTMLVMRLYKDTNVHLDTSWWSVIMKALVFINVRFALILTIHALRSYIYPIPGYVLFNLIMSYPFFFEPGRKKWEAYLCLTLGYNFLFGLGKAFYDAQFTNEVEFILLIGPPLAGMVYKDIFK